MATQVQVSIDCADPAALCRFWVAALHYKLQDPPDGFDTWPDFLRSAGVPEQEWNSASAAVDPDGSGPRIYFQRVPEPKTVKNRVHLDLNVGGGPRVPEEERRRLVGDEVERLVGLGATAVQTFDRHGEYWVVLRDPEGNELCVQ